MTKSVVLVFTGPSGAGKSTLLQMLMRKFPDRFAFSCSHTTRKMRVGEVDGRDYHFTTKEKMLQDIAAGKFWEHAEFAGNLYGTSVAAVEDILDPLVRARRLSDFHTTFRVSYLYQVLATGRICILDVEMVGVRTIHSFQSPFNTKFILIRPPSIESLEQRLRERNTETDETLRLRIQRARQDIEFAESPAGRSLFNKVVINNDLDTAYADLEEFLRPFIHQPTS
ncbi:guanylate kinase [Opisthorchis viverrini]|uniref:Guanylate kinase n=1 Tax=Opisthorchis viverrini TaxID=6198 RepID=A0A1S8WG90_OPIVI|nr:guanylate kinase [Opisthorchis viverrini]